MLSKDEIKHISALARIGVSEKEIEQYQKDLSAILDYFQKLKELDTEKVEPIGHITGRKNVAQEDKIQKNNDLEREEILKNIPDRKDDFVKVKSIL